jgi:hypothetical protein
MLSSQGKTTARQPQSEDEAVQIDMFQDAMPIRSLAVQALIEPAREEIIFEHSVRVSDLMPFLVNNPFVTPRHEWIIAMGLNAGFWGDFLTAAHLLMPQLESSVRRILHGLGIITSGFDNDGIQDEYNLNKLLRLPEYIEPLEKILGKDFVFDLRGLLIERFGSNLRNEMAHRLLDYGSFYSVPGCYVWWLILRFYLWPHFSIISTDNEESDPEDEN